jgi:7-cyano-7-deazaguanine synthase
MTQKKAVVLVSGGLDSTTVLAIARNEGYACYSMSFDYGQRHRIELLAAERTAAALGSLEHKVIVLDLRSIGGSALTDDAIAVPEDVVEEAGCVPITYVPARNTVFLSIALGWAEVLGADDIFIGVNAVDFSGYPDCRPDYIAAYEVMANLATRSGIEGRRLSIRTPLMHLSKAEIIQLGQKLGVDYSLTVSCYQANAKGDACGKCDSCRLRRQGFVQAGVVDPTPYAN